MRALELALIEGEQLLVALRKGRRDLKDLVGTSRSEVLQSNQQLLDEIIELSMDDVPVDQWPPQAASHFLSHLVAVVIEKGHED